MGKQHNAISRIFRKCSSSGDPACSLFSSCTIALFTVRDRSLLMGVGGMGEKMGGPEILATAKRGVLGKVFVIEVGGGGVFWKNAFI